VIFKLLIIYFIAVLEMPQTIFNKSDSKPRFQNDKIQRLFKKIFKSEFQNIIFQTDNPKRQIIKSDV